MSTPTCTKFNDRSEYRVGQDLHREDGPAIEYNDGRQVWYKNGKCHRDGGPAYFNPNEIDWVQVKESWWQNGKCHRLDGPARTYGDGKKQFWIEGISLSETAFNEKIKAMNHNIPVSSTNSVAPQNNQPITHKVNGVLHREDGPAFQSYNSSDYRMEIWYKNGKCHREFGPAVIDPSGNVKYFLQGLEYSKDEYITKMKALKATQGEGVGPTVSHCASIYRWYKPNTFISHRENGPAYVDLGAYTRASGIAEAWYLNGKPHRTNGPAFIYNDGRVEYYLSGRRYSKEEYHQAISKLNTTSESKMTNGGMEAWRNSKGQLHREDGHALEYSDGSKYWYQDGACHRLDGPASELSNGLKEWYVNGKSLSESEFNSHPDVIKFRNKSEKADKVVDMSKEDKQKVKVDGEGFFNNVKKNAVTAAPRVLAKTISKGARQGLLQLMKAKKLKKHWIKSIEEMMETEYGLAAISMGLSLVFKYVPGLKDDPRAAMISDEFQVGSIELAGNELVDEVMAVMLPAIMQYQNLSLPTEKLRVAPAKEKNTSSDDEEEEATASIPPLQAATLKVA